MSYRVVKEEIFTTDKVTELTDTLATAFTRNELLYGYVFANNDDKLWHFMHICVTHYSQHGMIYACYDEDNKIVGVSIWLEPHQLEQSLSSIKFQELREALVYIGIPTIARIISLQIKLNKCKVEKPYCYLFMLSATARGVGKILFQHAIDTYKGTKLYWESSHTKNDHAFYRNFGATEIDKTYINNIENVFFTLENKLHHDS